MRLTMCMSKIKTSRVMNLIGPSKIQIYMHIYMST